MANWLISYMLVLPHIKDETSFFWIPYCANILNLISAKWAIKVSSLDINSSRFFHWSLMYHLILFSRCSKECTTSRCTCSTWFVVEWEFLLANKRGNVLNHSQILPPLSITAITTKAKNCRCTNTPLMLQCHPSKLIYLIQEIKYFARSMHPMPTAHATQCSRSIALKINIFTKLK